MGVAASGGRDSLISVYSKRVAEPLLNVLREHKVAVLARWARELPTPTISPHFAVVSADDRARFVEETFGIYRRLLAGEGERMAEAPEGDEQQNTYFNQYLLDIIPFFKERGFAISDVMRAITRLEVIAEPLAFAAYQHDASAYRRAKSALREAGERLASAFAEG
jgi:hypothetical protein